MAQKQGGFGFGSRLEWPGLGQRQGDSGAFRPRGSKVPRRRPQPRCLRETKRIIESEGGICVVAETDSLLEEDGFEPPVPLGSAPRAIGRWDPLRHLCSSKESSADANNVSSLQTGPRIKMDCHAGEYNLRCLSRQGASSSRCS